jgi:phage repressor protein C with HTH and peptisase S24 domain
MPAGANWDEIEFPDLGGEKVFALEVTGDSMMPLYRDGEILVISPTASIRKGDRVVVRTGAGEVMVKELKRKTAKSVELRSLNPDHEDRIINMSDVAWMGRVMWARQ